MSPLWMRVFATYLLFAVWPLLAFAKCDRPLSVGWEPWEPYMYLDTEGHLTGLDIDIIRAVAQQTGCQLHFFRLPFKRHLAELEGGRIDLATSVQKIEERGQFAYYSVPYRHATMNLIVRKGEAKRFPYTSFHELAQSQIRVGLVLGYFYGPDVQAYLDHPTRALQLEAVISDETNLKKLLAGRVDAILADPLVIHTLAKEQGLVEFIEVHSLSVFSAEFFIIGSKASLPIAWMQDMDQALMTLKASGVIDELEARYLPASSP